MKEADTELHVVPEEFDKMNYEDNWFKLQLVTTLVPLLFPS